MLTVFCFVILYQTCSEKRAINKLKTEVTSLSDKTDKQLTQDEYLLIQKIETYKFLSENLYVNNAIVRTVIRPDDKINEYTQEINKLEKQLNVIRENKKSNK